MVRIRLSKEKRKEIIKNATMQLILDKGINDTNINDIIKASNTSAGGIYHYYKNKEEIYFDLIKDSINVRKKLAVKYILKNKDVDKDELIVDVLVEKLVDSYYTKPMYSIILTYLKDNKSSNLIAMFNEMEKDSYKQYSAFLKRFNLDKFIQLYNDEISFFTNSILLGMYYCPSSNVDEVKKMIKIMLNAYLKQMKVIK